MVKGFGRRPLADGRAESGAGVRKPPKEETAGRKGAVWRARLWGFEGRGRLSSEASAADDAGCFQRKRRRRTFSKATMRGSEALASVEGGLATARGQRSRAPARGWTRNRSTLRSRMRGVDHHEVSILIRVGGGGRAGRTPSKVSTTIIRPPQHGQQPKDEAGSASPSALADALSGETLDGASNCRARSMF